MAEQCRLNCVTDDVWEISTPLRFLSVAVGTRMTVVRFPSGGLLLHSPISIDSGLQEQLAGLGQVKHIVVPNLFHHLFALKAQELYPDAVLSAPKSIEKKQPELRIDRELSIATAVDWEGVLEQVTIDGSILLETVLFHRPSHTLITADLVENFETHDDWWTRQYLKLGGVYGKAGCHRLLRLAYRDRKAARKSLDRILAFDFERVIVAHGAVITLNAHERIRKAFDWI